MAGVSAIIYDEAVGQWISYANPVAYFEARTLEEVPSILTEVEGLVESAGYQALGWVSYEASPAFDAALAVKRGSSGFPLAAFGLFRAPKAVSAALLDESIVGRVRPACETIDWQPFLAECEYFDAIRKLKAAISYGATYQANFSFRFGADFAGDSLGLFAELVKVHGHRYAAYFDFGRWVIASASPELFFRLDGTSLACRPMKGTRRRHIDRFNDHKARDGLISSPKDRAENIMIVDMVRNDLSRVAEAGSVRATRLFEAEAYPRVWQMTSTVTASTEAPLGEIFSALFPCASITGAPKRQTMNILAEVESSPRGLYTGAIGWARPGRQAQFAVAIRTVSLDRENERAEYGAGSGIVWDSTAEAEFEECQAKAPRLGEIKEAITLLETILWTPEGGFSHLSYHRERLERSIEWLGWRVFSERVFERLLTFCPSGKMGPCRVRLTVNEEGESTVSAEGLDALPADYTVSLARCPVSSSNALLSHKTTNRKLYDEATHCHPRALDVLLWNDSGEITEGRRANLLYSFEGKLYTPPVSSGLLPGTARARLLDEGLIEERVLLKDELSRCEALWFVNAFRGRWPIRLLLTDSVGDGTPTEMFEREWDGAPSMDDTSGVC